MGHLYVQSMYIYDAFRNLTYSQFAKEKEKGSEIETE